MSDPTALPNFAPPPGDRPLRGRVIDALQDLGMQPNIDTDGDVEFTNDGQRMFVRCADPEQPGQMAVMRIFGQWQIQEPAPQDRLARLERCNDMTMQLNIIKIGLAGESLLVSGEHIIHPDTDLTPLVAVTTGLILQSVGWWFQSWTEQPTDQPPTEADPTV